jgi:hypothetical protein
MQVIDKEIDVLNLSDLKQLLDVRPGLHVSLYLPTHRKGPEIQQDPLVLRHLIDEAQAQLTAIGVRRPDAESLLAPARTLVEAPQNRFWQHQGEGLALFLCQDQFLAKRTPVAFQPTIHVGRRFVVRPLLPALAGDAPFYVLALSQHQVRLLAATQFTIGEIPLPDVPRNLEDTLRYYEFERQVRVRSAGSPGAPGGNRASAYHGHGSASDEASLKRHLLEYVHAVESGVSMTLAEQTAPLVLAGVAEMQGLYRGENRYRYLLPVGIDVNPDPLTAEDLQHQAWELVAPHTQEAQTQALALFQQLVGTGDGRAAYSLEGVLPAALYRRVDTLFVPASGALWGTFDEEANRVELHPEPQAGDEDLLDYAVYHTLRHGGTIFPLPPEQMPLDAPIAAIYRY